MQIALGRIGPALSTIVAALACACSSTDAGSVGSPGAGGSAGAAGSVAKELGGAGMSALPIGGGGATPAVGGGGASALGGAGGTEAGGFGGSQGGASAGAAAGGVGGGGLGGGAGENPGGNGNVGPTPDKTTRVKCTGTSPITCHFGGNPGYYAVSVVLGGSAAASTEVEAEMHRLMLEPVVTTAGTTQRYTFDVNVRMPEGQPVEDGPTEGTPGLDLYFYGSKGGPGETAPSGPTVAPLLDSIGFAEATSPVKVYVAGDSTVCDQSDTDYSGWAQMLPAFFDYPVAVSNYADSGESSGSFLNNGKMWGAIKAEMSAGDWVLIQFGHNDSKDTGTSFHDNILAMVTQAKAKGGKPVLVTPPARATFSGQTLSSQFVYADFSVVTAMKQVSSEQNVPLIDLTSVTTDWYNKMGPTGWQAYHALGTDKTHTNRAGALAIAGFAVAAIKAQNLGLLPYLRP